MVRAVFLYFAWTASLLTGCHVAMPTHQLPQGYSESYRRILQDQTRVEVPFESKISEFDSPLLTPSIPILLPEMGTTPEFMEPTGLDSIEAGPEPGKTSDAI